MGNNLLNIGDIIRLDFSPNASYTAAEEVNNEGQELKELIRELHENGIEVILDVVFNHTAEGNENGPFFSFKGFDNNIYYLLTPEGNYYNFSGCGNSLNCNHPVVQQMILECLRHWTVHYRVDGFRFDLASILGRDEDGMPMNNPPLLKSLAYDPLLRNVKLIAEAWDAGGLYQVGNFPASKRWAEWNGQYRDTMRGYLKVISGKLTVLHGEFVVQVTCMADITLMATVITLDTIPVSTSSHVTMDLQCMISILTIINTMRQMVGTIPMGQMTIEAGIVVWKEIQKDPEVLKLRYRMIRNACAILMCSRGTPMFFSGDEFGNTKFGNNNSYCQDNEISWIDWSLLEKNKDLFEFFKFMIDYRKKHPVIRKKLTMQFVEWKQCMHTMLMQNVWKYHKMQKHWQ